MNINYIFSFVLLTSSSILISIGYYAWKRDKLYVSLSLIPVMIYSFGYAFEILCTNIEEVNFWIKIEYIGIPFLGVAWIWVMFNFNGYKDYLKKNTLRLLFFIPIITLILNYTNDFHHWFYTEMHMDYQGIFPIVAIIKGPWYWVNVIYTYSLMLIGSIVFILSYSKSVSIIRRQIVLIIISCTIPWIADIIYTLRVIPFDIDLCPFALSFSGILYSYAILKVKLLKLTPIALEKVFSNMSDGVIILDYEENIVNFNQVAKDILPDLNYIEAGYKKIDEVFKEYNILLKEIKSNDYDKGIISLKNNRAIRKYRVAISDIYDNNSKIMGSILTFHDITEVREKHEKLLQMNEFKDKLFTIVSHDIKSPLGVLVSLLELLDDGEDFDEEENKEILYEIKLNLKNTYEMVENVLQWFRSKMDGIAYNSMTWKLSDIVKNSLIFLKQNAELKEIKVLHEIPKDIFAYVDKDMLEIVMRNIFSNAIKFTNKGGTIKVFANELDGMVTIAIEDNGVGMESTRLEEIFGDSYCHTTLGTLGEKGTGIGLMICREFIEKGNGKMWAESMIGKGTTFYFTILSDKAHEEIEEQKSRLYLDDVGIE